MIYVIGESRTGFVKIGTAVDPRSRLSVLQISNPRPLHVLLTLPGGHDEERGLHRAFASRRVGGEWFDFSDQDAVVAVAAAAAIADDLRPMEQGPSRAPQRAPRDPECTTTCVLACFTAGGEPESLPTRLLIDALNDGPDAVWWRQMSSSRSAQMALAHDLRTHADAHGAWLHRSSMKVPVHDGTGRFVNGWWWRDLEGLRSLVVETGPVGR